MSDSVLHIDVLLLGVTEGSLVRLFVCLNKKARS